VEVETGSWVASGEARGTHRHTNEQKARKRVLMFGTAIGIILDVVAGDFMMRQS
jgi:hypothetical protein